MRLVASHTAIMTIISGESASHGLAVLALQLTHSAVMIVAVTVVARSSSFDFELNARPEIINCSHDCIRSLTVILALSAGYRLASAAMCTTTQPGTVVTGKRKDTEEAGPYVLATVISERQAWIRDLWQWHLYFLKPLVSQAG
jgi:hypothetical protein